MPQSGLGTHAIQLARRMGAACVVAVDIDDRALERARRLGANLALNPLETDVPKAIREHLDGERLDLALECVGHPDAVQLALRSLGKGSRAVLVGVGLWKTSGRKAADRVAVVRRCRAVMGTDCTLAAVVASSRTMGRPAAVAASPSCTIRSLSATASKPSASSATSTWERGGPIPSA